MEVHCVGVVSESSSGGFCGSSGTGLFGMFESNFCGREHVCGNRCMSP